MSGSVYLLPYVALAMYDKSQVKTVLDELAQRINHEVTPPQAKQIWGIIKIFLGLRFPNEEIDQMIMPLEQFEDSVVSHITNRSEMIMTKTVFCWSLIGQLFLGILTLGVVALAEDAPKKDAPNTAAKSEATPKEAASNKEAATEKKWRPLFDGKTLDGWKVTEFGTGGEIEVEKDHILIGYGDGCTGLTWTKDFPKVDYEVLVEAQRVDGTDFFCGLTFPVQESPCSLIVGGWGGALVGLSSIDGADASENATKLYMTFKNKQWYQVRLRVTKTHISAWIDDKRVIHQATAGHKFTIRPEVQKSLPFGICSWCTTSAIRKAEVRQLTKEESEQVEAAKPAEPTEK